jgi:hypothetical protein
MATIKKIILLALTSLMMVGCFNGNDEYKAPYKNGGLQSRMVCADMCTVVIDSCEYIGTRYQLAHKGNCRFCEERRQKELEELVEQLKEK